MNFEFLSNLIVLKIPYDIVMLLVWCVKLGLKRYLSISGVMAVSVV